MPGIAIRPLVASPAIRDRLGALLVEVVAHGGSVGFVHPLAAEQANAFRDGALAAAGRGERIVLGAGDGDALVGTVSLRLYMPPNTSLYGGGSAEPPPIDPAHPLPSPISLRVSATRRHPRHRHARPRPFPAVVVRPDDRARDRRRIERGART